MNLPEEIRKLNNVSRENKWPKEDYVERVSEIFQRWAEELITALQTVATKGEKL